MNHITSPNELTVLIIDQESDALDDGFAYERMGEDIALGQGGWITPTAFMIVSMKELLTALVAVYGWHGHWLLRDIGKNDLRNPEFISGLGIGAFCRLYDIALAALPEDQRADFQ